MFLEHENPAWTEGACDFGEEVERGVLEEGGGAEAAVDEREVVVWADEGTGETSMGLSAM